MGGIDVFPGLPPAARATAMPLPDPHVLSRDDEAHPRRERSWQEWIGREFARAARKMVRDLLRAIF